MAYTGKQRSLSVTINKTLGGEVVESYPHSYDGKQAFSINDSSYAAITVTQMAQMTIADYQDRLAKFKLYVQALEPGLDIDSVTVAGSEAYKINTDSCPIGFVPEPGV